MSVVFYPGLHFESEKGHPNFRKTRSPIVENPASVKNGYLRTGSKYHPRHTRARESPPHKLPRFGAYSSTFSTASLISRYVCEEIHTAPQQWNRRVDPKRPIRNHPRAAPRGQQQSACSSRENFSASQPYFTACGQVRAKDWEK